MTTQLYRGKNEKEELKISASAAWTLEQILRKKQLRDAGAVTCILFHAVLCWSCHCFPAQSDTKITGNSARTAVLHPPAHLQGLHGTGQQGPEQAPSQSLHALSHLQWHKVLSAGDGQTQRSWEGVQPLWHSELRLKLLCIPPATPTNHHKDGPTYLLCVSYFAFLANWTFNARSCPRSKLFQSLGPGYLKDWAKVLNEDGSQQPSSSAEGNLPWPGSCGGESCSTPGQEKASLLIPQHAPPGEQISLTLLLPTKTILK